MFNETSVGISLIVVIVLSVAYIEFREWKWERYLKKHPDTWVSRDS